ncbi:phage tail tape measure protein, partial [Escherichia coli]|nr:phage tail tape measure protein [Escherichia coli]
MANKKLNATITIGGAVSGSLRGAFGTVKKNTVEIGSAISKLSREQRQLNEAMKRYGQDSAIFSRMKDRYQTVVGQVERLRSATERLKRVE